MSVFGAPIAVPETSRCAHGVPSTNRCRNCAAVMEPPWRPPVFFMSANCESISLSYSDPSGMRQTRSPVSSPILLRRSASSSLLENMPDGNAQRPGDIVTTMSGQTIEIINTDAEGRLVLADVLWYVQDRFKPKFMVDLATLTGAILVALAQEYAGLFSNNDELAERLTTAGKATGERVWRMPLGPEFDKMIDSKFADMKNSAGRYGGSSTAAALLQRFVNDVPWAHLDIAGTAMGSPQNEINKGWASGWGVRLLDRLVRDYYEA